MQKALSILVVSQIICISTAFSQKQTTPAQENPATNACPDWNKKQPVSKASYFAYLRKRPVAKEVKEPRDFNAPKYWNYNAAAPAAKKQTLVGATKNAEQEHIAQPTAPIKSKSIIKAEEAPLAKPVEIVQQPKLIEETPTAVAIESPAPAEGKGKANTTIKKEEKEKKAARKKVTNKTRPVKQWFKKLRFRKNATSCPDF